MNETPVQCADRLIRTLESLSAEENCLMRNGDFNAAIALQSRTQPVIDRLVELVKLPELRESVETLWRQRVAPLVNSRQANTDMIRARMAEITVRLRASAESQRTLKKLSSYQRTSGRSGALAASV